MHYSYLLFVHLHSFTTQPLFMKCVAVPSSMNITIFFIILFKFLKFKARIWKRGAKRLLFRALAYTHKLWVYLLIIYVIKCNYLNLNI